MAQLSQSIPELGAALRDAMRAIVAHPDLQGIRPSEDVEDDAFVVGADGKWAQGTASRRIAFVPRPPRFGEIIFSACEKNGIPAILRKLEPPAGGRGQEPPPDGQARASAYGLCVRWGVLTFISDYVKELDDWRFDDAIFDRMYAAFEHFVRSGKSEYQSVVPLRHFSSEVDAVELDKRVSVVRTSDEQRARWGAELAHAFPPTDGAVEFLNPVFESGFAVIVRTFHDRSEPLQEESISDEMRRFLTAMRLLREPRDPEWSIKLTFPVGFHPVGGVFSGLRGQPTPTPQVPRGKCHLTRERVPELRDLWSRLKDPRGLEVGLRRFNDVHVRDNLEDKLIDMAILLESTLLVGVRDELRFRLMLRGARLLSEDRPPSATAAILKALYDERSGVVHGNGEMPPSIKVGDEEPIGSKEFVARLQDVCTDVLLTLLRDLPPGMGLRQRMEQLDKEAIEGMTPPSGAGQARSHQD